MTEKKKIQKRRIMRRAKGTEATISTLVKELKENEFIEIADRTLERRFEKCAEELNVDLSRLKDESGHYGLAGDQVAKARALLLELSRKDGMLYKITFNERDRISEQDLFLTYNRMGEVVEKELDGVVKDEFINFLDECMVISYTASLKAIFEGINNAVIKMDSLPYEHKKEKMAQLRDFVSDWSENVDAL